MASDAARTSTLQNHLATLEQLESSSSQLDGVSADLENSVRFAGAKLTQAAGVLLKLPQDVIASAIVLFARFWVGPEGGSLLQYGAKDVAAACLYLATKLSAYPRSPRSILNVFAYLDANPAKDSADAQTSNKGPEAYYVSEGIFQEQRLRLIDHELAIIRVIGFQTHVALPYTLCINYLQLLNVLPGQGDEGQQVARRVFAYLNSALLSPQLLYLTHQPPQLAVAAIYLAAREVGVKLPEEEWWEVFDTEREELGFLVVALLSVKEFAAEEFRKWEGNKVPMTLDDLSRFVGVS